MGSGIYYPNIPGGSRRTWDKHGERVSLLDYMAVYPDPSTALNAAIAAALALTGTSSRGVMQGYSIQIPAGTYILTTPIIITNKLGSATSFGNLTIYGEGQNTVLLRGADMPTGYGLFTISAPNITFRNLVVDGNVTESVGLLYSAFGDDPMNALLVKNTSFWVQGPASNITFDHVTVQHTGGYAILLDTTTTGAKAGPGPITNILIEGCLFQNNRPHLFGISSGDLSYGSWTGGIHYQGDGYLNAVTGMTITGCVFQRNTGNQVWGHLYNFDALHANIVVTSCTFMDIGLDGVETGGVVGGSVDSNMFRRIGYICSDDTSASVPKFLVNAPATAIDTAGMAVGVNYTGNTIISANNGYINLDGFQAGTVANNMCRTPRSTDPEYGPDQIATVGWAGSVSAGGPCFDYGIQSNSTWENNGALGISITGNSFINIAGGPLQLYAAQNCHVTGNRISCPPVMNKEPIALGGVVNGFSNVIQCTNNVVTGNFIDWSPPTPQPIVVEDEILTPYLSSDVNYVYNNTITGNGNAYEVQINVDSSSLTQQTFSSNSPAVSAVSAHIVQREGNEATSTSVLRWYGASGSAPKRLQMNLQTYRNAGQVVGPLLNVSDVGGAGTGVIATGPRTESADFGDAVETGKLYADSFLALSDTTYKDADANTLPSSVALFRYSAASGGFQQSISVGASGVRVWTPFGGNTQVLTVASLTGAYTVSSTGTSPSDGQWLLVVVVQGATGYAVSFDSGFTMIASGEVPETPDSYSTILFAGNTALSKWLLVTATWGRSL